MNQEPWYKIPNFSYKSKNAIIIGGGLAGTSAAFSLARCGWKITLIERNNNIAQGASGNPAGILMPLISHKDDLLGKFFLSGFDYTLNHIKEIGVNSFDQCGVLVLESSKVNKNIDDLITAQISEKKTDGIFISKAGWVSPEEICRANINAYKDNINLITNTEAMTLEKENDEWVVNDIYKNQIAKSEVVIIANSNDALNFSQSNWMPLHNVRGQITYLKDYNNEKIKSVICYDGGYITPEINGICYVGATFGVGDNNPKLSINDHKENIDNLRNHFDVGSVDYNSLDGRVSFRASSPDRRPMVSAVACFNSFKQDYFDICHGRQKKYPDGKYLKGLYISVGHGSRGITSCPIAGEILAEMITGKESKLPKNILDILNPARFIIRKLKRS
ncbi:FAD-dependent 5-carboxymethylaminomethyl-2-thiouridine(34) oxidoreductase MnmC [Rickettsiales bacterium]|nr:FAD-dependent 5-carboxymethylaminomethyl-2-thiouridine(34) oxidoreductase MnmC [Rickettsiales bacterium]